jgi:hypothetical protein
MARFFLKGLWLLVVLGILAVAISLVWPLLPPDIVIGEGESYSLTDWGPYIHNNTVFSIGISRNDLRATVDLMTHCPGRIELQEGDYRLPDLDKDGVYTLHGRSTRDFTIELFNTCEAIGEFYYDFFYDNLQYQNWTEDDWDRYNRQVLVNTEQTAIKQYAILVGMPYSEYVALCAELAREPVTEEWYYAKYHFARFAFHKLTAPPLRVLSFP